MTKLKYEPYSTKATDSYEHHGPGESQCGPVITELHVCQSGEPVSRIGESRVGHSDEKASNGGDWLNFSHLA